ncbi:MAG: hypothetical protein ACYC35_10605 [Pirellulales bacterium]
MFPLHDSTRRWLCRLGFCVLCVLPTVAVLAGSLWIHLPWHARGYERELSRRLGLAVTFASMTHPRPGVIALEGLTLADPETGMPILQCRRVEAERTRAALVLTASRPVLEADRLAQTWRLLERQLRPETGWIQSDLKLASCEVVLRAGNRTQTLTEVQGQLTRLAGGSQAEVRFRLAGSEAAPKPAQILVVRNRQMSPPATGFDLQTGDTPLPCSVLTAAFPGAARLGPRSTFTGRVWANNAADGWEGEITGQVAEIDLHELVTTQFPHKLSGMAQLRLKRGRFRHGRVEEAAGTLVAGRGIVSRSLVTSAVDSLQLVPGVDVDQLETVLDYDQLAMEFTLDAAGLAIQGRCQKSEPGAILVERYRTLLAEPRSGPQPIDNLVRTLVPHNEVLVPATRETAWLVQVLPVPQLTLPPGASTTPLEAERPPRRGLLEK